METIQTAYMIDLCLRTLGLLFVLFIILYWYFTEKHADKVKPKEKNTKSLKRIATDALWFIVLLQLTGISILPFSQNIYLQIFGAICLVLGTGVCIVARQAIGTNWTHGAEFQVKKHQTLVTHSIYKYIRHPIYTGFFLVVFGAELIANSYLAFLLLVILVPLMAYQTQQEERMLTRHFGEAYKSYMKRSKMFVPYFW